MQPLHQLFEFLAKNRKFVAAWLLLAIALLVIRHFGLGPDPAVKTVWTLAEFGGLSCGCLLVMDAAWALWDRLQTRRARLAEARQADAIAWSNLQACTALYALSLMYIVYQTERQRFIGPADNEQLKTLVELKLLERDGPYLSDGKVAYKVRDSVWTKLSEGSMPPPWDDLRVPDNAPWIKGVRLWG